MLKHTLKLLDLITKKMTPKQSVSRPLILTCNFILESP
jgi:hypothetical protein